MSLQAEEFRRAVTMLGSLDTGDWAAPTDCPDWGVRRMDLHVLGACEAGASRRENARQPIAAQRRQKAFGAPLEAALSAVQVEARLGLSPDALVEALHRISPQTIRARTKMSATLRRVRIKVDGPVVERWSLGYLTATIYLRDLWMHRVDASRSTGAPLELTAAHDGAIVADVVAEWARRHAQPYRLTLRGPAGGRFDAEPPDGGDAVDGPALDAIEFCRKLSGRAPGSGLLATVVPF